MIPRVEIDATTIPGTIPGGQRLRLIQRGAEFSITLDGNELMNSRLSGSEEALAKLAIDALGPPAAWRILIGGLGMGFTLRAALKEIGPDVDVTVAELVPAVIRWARGPLAGIFDGCLDDPRVDVVEADVRNLITPRGPGWDAILLDVDNGPDGLSTEANGRLYSPAGLRAARAALRPGGVLAVWSAAPDEAFARRMHDAGFGVETHRVRASRGKGAHHVIWLGRAR